MAHSEHTSRELALLALANGQQGIVHGRQLRRRGLTPSAVLGRVQTGRLTRLHDEVFAWGHSALTREGRWLAALWATDPKGALSHQTAGAHDGLTDEEDGVVHVSTTRRGIHSRPGIVVHRVSRLDPLDVRCVGLLRVTRPPRTIVDLADVLEWEGLRAAADLLHRLTPAQLRGAQQRAPGRTGRGRVARLLEADQAHTKSELERLYLRLLRRQGLRRPTEVNGWVAGMKADVLHAGSPPLVVELDGRAHHQRRAQMAVDRRRDERYQLAGHRILRLLWDDLQVDAEASTAARVRRMLSACAPDGP